MNEGTLLNGVWVWLWPRDKWPAMERNLDRDLAFLKANGVTGVIPQAGLSAPAWVTKVHAQIAKHGLKVLVGLGMDSKSATEQQVADAIVASIRAPSSVGCMLNWESFWSGKKDRAKKVVELVLKAQPDAPKFCTDAPWWAPLYVMRNGQKAWTHPSAPSAEFGILAARDRYPQTYGANVKGAPDGASMRMLQHSRSPGQYAAIATQARVQPWTIRPSLQMYVRSSNDVVQMLLDEPNCCLWDVPEWDEKTKVGLRAWTALRAKGFGTSGGVRAFQASAGLTADNSLGPKTIAALGITG